jgi:lipopolysaccharide biosynthesis glycosyltransferase
MARILPTSPNTKVRDIVLVSASDDGYAMPLAVTIRSALNHLAADRRVQLFILDGGLTQESKSHLLKSWNDPRLTVEWIRPDLDLVRDLFVSYQVTIVTYLRLLMADLLPEDVTRAIYIDADMLVRRDLGKLWDEAQDGHAVLAVREIAAPYIDAAAAMPNFENCREHLCAFTPIMNYRELGLSADAEYFNGGLLVADIAEWRRESFSQQMLACLRQHREHVLWWDQYALNVVLAGKWRALDCRWNQGTHVYAYPNWRKSPVDAATFEGLRKSPWIVHFCSPSKPWHYFCRHPFRREFYRCLEQTDWRGWRPERPDNLIKLWWDFHYAPVRSQWKSRIRGLKQAVRSKRRKAA